MKMTKSGGLPLVLVRDQVRIGRLIIDEKHVYWTDAGMILKVEKNGGEPVVLARGRTRGNRGPSGIVVDEAQVHWTNYFDEVGSVMRSSARKSIHG